MTDDEQLAVKRIESALRLFPNESALTSLIYRIVHRCATSSDRQECARWLELADTALLNGGRLALEAFGQ